MSGFTKIELAQSLNDFLKTLTSEQLEDLIAACSDEDRECGIDMPVSFWTWYDSAFGDCEGSDFLIEAIVQVLTNGDIEEDTPRRIVEQWLEVLDTAVCRGTVAWDLLRFMGVVTD